MLRNVPWPSSYDMLLGRRFALYHFALCLLTSVSPFLYHVNPLIVRSTSPNEQQSWGPMSNALLLLLECLFGALACCRFGVSTESYFLVPVVLCPPPDLQFFAGSIAELPYYHQQVHQRDSLCTLIESSHARLQEYQVSLTPCPV